MQACISNAGEGFWLKNGDCLYCFERKMSRSLELRRRYFLKFQPLFLNSEFDGEIQTVFPSEFVRAGLNSAEAGTVSTHSEHFARDF